MQDPHSRTPPGAPLTAERRHDSRFPVRPTEYIEIGDSNGGIILDISQSGMAVATAQALVGNQTLKFRFQLPRQLEPIEVVGEIHWIGETRKRAGVRFVDLPVGAQEQISRWIALQTKNDIGELSGGSQPGIGSNGAGRGAGVHAGLTERSQEFLNGMSPALQGRNGNSGEHSEAAAIPASLDEAEADGLEEEPIYEPQAGDARAERGQPAERRVETRRAPNDSTYVEVDGGNAGLIGDLSESGLSLRAAKTLESDKIAVRFQVPGSQQFVDTQAWIVWKSASQKKAGARFDDLPDEARKHIAEWIGAKSSGDEAAATSVATPAKKAEVGIERAAPAISFLAPDSVPIPAYISPITQKVIAVPVAAAAADSVAVATTLSIEGGKDSATATIIPVAPVTTPVVSRPAAPKPGVLAPSVPKQVAPAVPAKTSAPVVARATTLSSVPAHAASTRFDIPVPLVEEAPAFTSKRDLSILSSKSTLGNSTAVLPAAYPDSSWYLAPKKRFGFWKIAALVVVAAGVAAGGNYFYRNRQTSAPGTEIVQQQSANAPGATEVEIPEPEDFKADSGNGAPAEAGQSPTGAVTPETTRPAHPEASTGASTVGAGAGLTGREAAKIKGDEQFVDEPREPKFVDAPRETTSLARGIVPQSSQNSAAPVSRGNSSSSNTQTATPVQSVPRPATANSGGSGSALNSSATTSAVGTTPASSEANAPHNTSTHPVAGVSIPPSSTATQNSSPANPSTGNSALPGGTISGGTTPGAAAPTAGSPVSGAPPAANSAVSNPPVPAPQNLVGTVSFFSRFRAIRGGGDVLNGGPPNAGGMLQIGAMASSPVPAYPPEALRQQIQGLVELDVFVGTDGTVQSVHLVRGPAELAAVAMSAVRGWRYSPTVLGGKPVEAQQSVFFTFKLGK
jgi:TonB family protein